MLNKKLEALLEIAVEAKTKNSEFAKKLDLASEDKKEDSNFGKINPKDSSFRPAKSEGYQKKQQEPNFGKINPKDSSFRPVKESYTKENLLKLFEALDLDTDKYTFEYLAEELGFEAKEFLNESTGKTVVLYEGIIRKGLTGLGFGALAAALTLAPPKVSEVYADDYLLNKARQEYANVMDIDVDKVGARTSQDHNSTRSNILKLFGSNVGKRDAEFYYQRGLDVHGDPNHEDYLIDFDRYWNGKGMSPEEKIEQELKAEEAADKVYDGEDSKNVRKIAKAVGQAIPSLTGAGWAIAASKKKGIKESYTQEDLLELFEALDLDTDKYTFEYLVEELGFVPEGEVEMEQPEVVEMQPQQDPEYDEEGSMAKSQLITIADAAAELYNMMEDETNLPEWVQSKLTLSKEYIDTVRDYLKSEMIKQSQDMDEMQPQPEMEEVPAEAVEQSLQEKYVLKRPVGRPSAKSKMLDAKGASEVDSKGQVVYTNKKNGGK